MDYEQFFGLKDTPFRLTLDKEYFYPSQVHREALQTLLDCIGARNGFIRLTGQPGTGKTLTIRKLLWELGEDVDIALILNPRLSPVELLRVILEDLEVSTEKVGSGSREELRDLLRKTVVDTTRKGRTALLIIDEAQKLPEQTLEELCLLSYLEMEGGKLLQILLVGQIELEERLRTADLRQLAQRITTRFWLDSLSKSDTFAYINHRLQIAGGRGNGFFSSRVLNDIYQASQGVPRLINIICERTMMAAFVDAETVIEKRHLQKALESIGAVETKKERSRPPLVSKKMALAFGICLMMIVVLFGGTKVFSLWPPDARKVTPPVLRASVMKGLARETGLPALAAVSPGGPLSALPTVEKEPAGPTPPTEAFHVPRGSYFLSVDRSSRKARLWRGSPEGTVLAAEFPWTSPPPEGLYLLGRSDKGVFFFNHPLFYINDPAPLPIETWPEAARAAFTTVLPMVSRSIEDKKDKPQAAQADEVRNTIKDWADAWQDKDIERLIQFYGQDFTAYYHDKNKPETYSRSRLYSVKKQILSRSGKISVTVTDPLCLIDPVDPGTAMAIFQQKYVSAAYEDNGIQTIYLRSMEDKSGQRSWKIVAKYWMPNDKK